VRDSVGDFLWPYQSGAIFAVCNTKGAIFAKEAGMIIRDRVSLVIRDIRSADAGRTRRAAAGLVEPKHRGSLRVMNVTRLSRWGVASVVNAPRALAAAMKSWAGRRTANNDMLVSSRAKMRDSRISPRPSSTVRTNAAPKDVTNITLRCVLAAATRQKRCLRHRKTLCTCVFATAVLTATAPMHVGGVDLANIVVSVAKAHAAHATSDDIKLVWVIKNGLRRATVLFARLCPRDDPRNIATMTSGIRN
jgi:hypothetical protein